MTAVPEGFATITPSLTLKDAASAIETYKKAFGAKEIARMEWPGTGKIMHAVLEIGNSKIFVADETPNCPASKAGFYLYMPDVDAAVKQAVQGGLKQTMPPEDMFWGDRLGAVEDAFGNQWTLATHIRDVSDADMEKGKEAFLEKMKAKPKAA